MWFEASMSSIALRRFAQVDGHSFIRLHVIVWWLIQQCYVPAMEVAAYLVMLHFVGASVFHKIYDVNLNTSPPPIFLAHVTMVFIRVLAWLIWHTCDWNCACLILELQVRLADSCIVPSAAFYQDLRDDKHQHVRQHVLHAIKNDFHHFIVSWYEMKLYISKSYIVFQLFDITWRNNERMIINIVQCDCHETTRMLLMYSKEL